ncbi:MAG: cellulose-binding protein [Cyanobacteria bacterium QH_9_48_43]|nr:MAG: cellulose-binding protein [Cyanobacteria bacterium QH_9_48_43]
MAEPAATIAPPTQQVLKMDIDLSSEAQVMGEIGAVTNPDHQSDALVKGVTAANLDFSSQNFSSYNYNQDKEGTLQVQDGGKTLNLSGNAWKKMDFSYEVTSDTVLEFDFRSSSEGDIHSIGLDDDNNFGNSISNFALYGTQSNANWNQDFNNYSGTDWKNYSINVGEYFTGQMNYLTLVNDHDVSNPDATSYLRNVKVYEANGNDSSGGNEKTFGSHSPLGTNLNHIADWSTEMPFLDAFKSSREWMTQNKDSWGTNERDKLDLDENGWIKSLPAPEDSADYTYVGTLLRREIGNYPEGKYVVLYDGKGTIEYGFDAQKNEDASTSGRDVINVNPSDQGIYLKITSTDPNQTGNYLRNIRVVPAEYEDNYSEKIFNPKFIDKIENFSTLRFMDWMETNNSDQSEWANRPKVEDASYAYGGGVPVETMVELANRVDANPWFNMPHKATDQYIKNFAQFVKNGLDSNLDSYVEYSNEVWNPEFEQYYWVTDNGPVSGENMPHKSYGVRTAQMSEIWKDVFGQQSNRVKSVMGTQTSNRKVAEKVLNYEKWDQSTDYEYGIDALGITGYFDGRLVEPEYESDIETWLNNPNIDEFDKALTQLRDGSVLGTEGNNVEDMANYFNDYSEIAEEEGLEVVAYEGGSSVAGEGGVQNNKKITDFLIELHRQPEFYNLYKDMLDTWEDSEGARTLFMNFVDIGKPSKWGSWGALEHVDQESSPRYDALIDFINKG